MKTCAFHKTKKRKEKASQSEKKDEKKLSDELSKVKIV